MSYQQKSPFAVLKPADATTAPGYQRNLTALSVKALKAQSKPEGTIDWDRRAALPRWMPRSLAAMIVSQFHYGEIATAQLCAEMSNRLPSPADRTCLEAQVEDEQRHARIYSRYLEKLGGIDQRAPRPACLLSVAAGHGESRKNGVSGLICWNH